MDHKVTFKHYLLKVGHNLDNLLPAILVFLAPINGILFTVALFIILDTITGIWKSRKLKIPITSRGLSAIVSKMLLYEMFILVTYLVGTFLVGDVLFKIFGVEYLLTKTVAMLLIYIEVKSINENYKAVKGINLWKEFRQMVSRTHDLKEFIKEHKDDFPEKE